MSDQTIFIVGASSDLGAELIKRLHPGTRIIAHCNNGEDRLESLARELHREIEIITADLSRFDATTTMIETIAKKYGVPSKIVHLAAPKFQFVRFKDSSWQTFKSELDVSFRSLVMILNSFLPGMAKNRDGKIVVMLSSVSVDPTTKALTHYTSTKFAMLGLIKALAAEYSDKNVQINAISPAMIETNFLSEIHDKHVELSANNHPLKRNAVVDDILPWIELLLSKDSDYLTGVNIPITGGVTI